MDPRFQNPTLNADTLRKLCADSLGGDGQALQPPWAMALAANFGSVERWREQFTAQAGTLSGARWVLLCFMPRDGTLVNLACADPADVPADALPLLALDAGASLEASVQKIDWAGVYARYQQGVHDASEAFAAPASAVPRSLLLDVRRAGVFAEAPTMIRGATWRDPSTVAEWSAELPRDAEVLVYCVYGHEVGRATALRLRAAGLDARFLDGGIDAWQAAGQPLQTREGTRS